MAERHHYVSQFHLRRFVDPTAITPDPWLWVGDVQTGAIRKRAPKKLAWKRGMFDGQGCLPDGHGTLEDYLANNVEAPAASALRTYESVARQPGATIPSEIYRYVAWAASRSLSMQDLATLWIVRSPPASEVILVEEPLLYASDTITQPMRQRLRHPDHGIRTVDNIEEIEAMRATGWELVIDAKVFGQLAHAQAYYFLERHFPRLSWVTLRPPVAKHLVLSDRPVFWHVNGQLDLEPKALRDPRVQLFAPLTPTLALAAFAEGGNRPRTLKPEALNLMSALAARSWIAGSSREVVERTMHDLSQVDCV